MFHADRSSAWRAPRSSGLPSHVSFVKVPVMPQRKPYLVIRMLAAALVAGAPIGAGLVNRRPLESSNQSSQSSSDQPPSAAERKRGHRIFLEPLARPTGEGNVRIRVKSGDTRTVSVDLQRLREDQKRYVGDLRKAKGVVSVKGRQKIRDEVPKKLPTHSLLKLKPGEEEELFPFCGLPELDPDEEELLIKNCLMITDLKVVEDPERTTGNGAWTFGTLMTNIANRGATGIEPAEFVLQWLKKWEEDRAVNLSIAPKRAVGIKQLIIEPWQAESGGPSKPLDLSKAPFRLLAIVSRVDLRNNLVLGTERIGGGGAGEARFVFCAYHMKEKTPMLFTVIFEYEIKRKHFHGVREWAEQWYALKNMPLGSTRYNKALQKITDQFAGAGIDPESPPNQSALSQLRTNEVALDQRRVEVAQEKKARDAQWELREFRIDLNSSGYLRQVTVKQSPDGVFRMVRSPDIYLSSIGVLGAADGGASLLATSALYQFSTILAQYVNGAEADILGHEHHVPVEFLGAAALTPPNSFWNDQGIRNPEARHLFSLGTCSGCHGREAFPEVITLGQNTHVRPRKSGQEAQLSPFLTGKAENGHEFVLVDPARQLEARRRLRKRQFHDLSNRAHDLTGLVEYGVIYEKERQPLQMVH